jgi:hypothetical protein
MIISPLASMRWATGTRFRQAGLAALLPLLALGCSKNSSSSSSAPTVTSFSPTTDASGTGTQIKVYGTGFSSATGVTICGVTVPSASSNSDNQVLSDTELEFDLPTVTTTGVISVTGSGGTGSSSQDFIVIPTISSIPAGRVGKNVTISGNGLLGVTGATFTGNGDSYPVTLGTATATTLVITIPSTMTGGVAYELTLANGYGVTYATATYTPES